MTPSVFIFSLTILFIILLLRQKLTDLINEKFEFPEGKKFQSEWIVYVLTVLLIIVVSYGMLMGVTDNPFGAMNVSGGVENMEDTHSQKPHRYFDINFNIFN